MRPPSVLPPLSWPTKEPTAITAPVIKAPILPSCERPPREAPFGGTTTGLMREPPSEAAELGGVADAWPPCPLPYDAGGEHVPRSWHVHWPLSPPQPSRCSPVGSVLLRGLSPVNVYGCPVRLTKGSMLRNWAVVGS